MKKTDFMQRLSDGLLIYILMDAAAVRRILPQGAEAVREIFRR